MQFFEVTGRDLQLANVGRAMMEYAAKVKDDELFNNLCRVGHDLTTVGAAFGKRVSDFNTEDQKLISAFIKANPNSTNFKIEEVQNA